MHPVERLESRLLFAAGGLDASFRSGTTTIPDSSDDLASAVIAIADGGFLLAGLSDGELNHGLGIARFDADGVPNPSFGQGGKTFVSLARFQGRTVAATMKDGRIVLAAATDDGHIGIARLLEDGSLDESFGQAGTALLSVSNQSIETRALAIRPDGRIVLAFNSGPNGFGGNLVQITADGRLDSTFDTTPITTAGPSDMDFQDLALLPDGRIVAAGARVSSAALARFEADGRFDHTFGTDSGLFVDSTVASFNSITLLRDGGVLAAGASDNHYSSDAPAIAWRHISPNFSSWSGSAFALPTGVTANIEDMVIQRGGKSVILSSVFVPGAPVGAAGHFERVLVRFNADGPVDDTFGKHGRALTTAPPDTYDQDSSLAGIGRQRLVVAGPRDHQIAPPDLRATLLTINGRADPLLTDGGRVHADVRSPGNASFSSLAALPDGRFLALAGRGGAADRQRLQLLRYNSDGNVDSTFNSGQPMPIDFGSTGDPGSTGVIVVSPDGDRFAIIAELYSPDQNVFPFGGIAMFHADGSKDLRFGTDGVVTLQRGTVTTDLGAALFQGDKLVVGGMADNGFLLARFNIDGSLDDTFGSQGTILTPFDPRGVEDYSRTTDIGDLLLDAAGRIVAIGNDFREVDMGFDNALAMARYTADGELDPTFGQNGKAGGLEAPPPWHVIVGGARIQADGKIVVGGSVPPHFPQTLDGTADVLRFNADGSPDLTFGGAGVAEVNVSEFAEDTAELFIQPDGKILIAGTTHYDGPYLDAPEDVLLVRFLSDGRLDPSFGNAGIVTHDFGNVDVIDAAIVSDDGRITIAGDSEQQPLLARFLLTPDDAASAQIVDGALTITGTPGPDTIRLRQVNGRLRISSVFQDFAIGSFSRILIQGLAGNDTLDASASPVPVILNGGDGNDVLLGGASADLLLGNSGNDTLFGGRGYDTLHGNDGNDYLSGGRGADQLFGDAGNDQLFALDGALDVLDGSVGFDRAKGDVADLLSGSEGLL